MRAIKTILVPIDFSDPSGRALAFAVDLAEQLAARVEVFSAHDGNEEDLVAATARSVDFFVDPYRERKVDFAKRIGQGDAREAIVALAREICADLIVMGTNSRKGIAHAFIGSVAESVVRAADVPVVTVR